MTTVLIVDDQPLQRSGFSPHLDSVPEKETVGEAAHGGETVRKAAELRPDVVLMDVRMPGVDGIEATRRVTATGDRSRVLVLTTFDLDEYVHAALRAGAGGRKVAARAPPVEAGVPVTTARRVRIFPVSPLAVRAAVV